MRTALLASVLVLTACGGGTPPATDSDALLARDRDFAAYSEAHGFAEAVGRYAAPNLVAVFSGAHPVQGREAVVQRLSRGAYTVTWEPAAARVSGALGYTRGSYRVVPDDPQDDVEFGHYLTVWERQQDGSWLVTVDMGNSAAEPDSAQEPSGT